MLASAIKYRDLEKKALQSGKKYHVTGPRIKVAFVLQSLTTCGAERALVTLMNGMDRTRFSPELIVMSEKGSLRDWVAPGILCHSFKNKGIKNGFPNLLARLNKSRPDIIVSTMAAMNYGVLLARPFLRKKAKIVIHEAVMPSFSDENRKTPWLVKSAHRKLYPQADLIISPAQYIIEGFKKYLDMDLGNHKLLHNPIDVERIRAEQIIQSHNDPVRRRTVRFVSAGRLHQQKGFDRLIEALPAIGTDDWTLDILGAGQEKEKLESLIAQHNLKDKVFLDGLVNKPWPVIGAADYFLMPSRWEGLPNVALESLACGTPVIAVKEAGGIQELADMAPRGAVTVVDSIEDMIKLMRVVEPNPSRVFRPSLLPEYFHQSNVIERFSRLLTESKPRAKVGTVAARRTEDLRRKWFGRRQKVQKAA